MIQIKYTAYTTITKIMKSFYINTATRQSGIAIYDGNKVLAKDSWLAEQNESEKLQPAVEKLLKENNLTPDDIDRLICCIGPGGFTSTRVGVSAVNAWAFAKNIPVAEVTVFDLYPGEKSIIVVSANSNEGWVKFPGKKPEFVIKEDLKLPAEFSFTGILNDEWREYLNSRGGEEPSADEKLPPHIVGETESFKNKVVLPWYYKDPNITWSDKIIGKAK